MTPLCPVSLIASHCGQLFLFIVLLRLEGIPLFNKHHNITVIYHLLNTQICSCPNYVLFSELPAFAVDFQDVVICCFLSFKLLQRWHPTLNTAVHPSPPPKLRWHSNTRIYWILESSIYVIYLFMPCFLNCKTMQSNISLICWFAQTVFTPMRLIPCSSRSCKPAVPPFNP